MTTTTPITVEAAGGKVHLARPTKTKWNVLCGCDKPRGVRFPIFSETRKAPTCSKCLAAVD